MDVVIGSGVEVMSRTPMGSDAILNPDPFGDSVGPISPKLSDLYEIIPQGISAGRVAQKYGISREAQDRFSLQSHEKAIAAIDEGRFTRELVPVHVQDNGASHTVEVDEGPRRETSYEKIASLAPAFEPEGMITAGNSSQISDGAAAVLVMSEAKVKELGLTPRARIVATAAVGTDPTLMLEGPIPATAKVLQKAGMKLSDIDLFEVNEAFASVVLAWLKDTGADPEEGQLQRRRDRARPPAWLQRRQADHHLPERAGAAGRPLRAGHHVHRPRDGDRHHHRASQLARDRGLPGAWMDWRRRQPIPRCS